MSKASAKKGQKKSGETPLMKQYNSIKAKHPDALLLFRVGDFYETFGEDAVKAAKILGIVLTKRANGAAAYIDLAGFPHHSLDTYLPKLVRAGYRVAICDQLEDPKQTKTIVKRGVTELVTPGVSYNDKTLDNKSNNFLACVYLQHEKNKENTRGGISFLDVSTGEFMLAEGNIEYIDKLLQSFSPNEVLYPKSDKNNFKKYFGDTFYTYHLDDWVFTKDYAYETLTKHFSTNTLKGFGVETLELGIIAAAGALHYLAETAHDKVQHISSLARIEEDHFIWLDRFTIRNLELLYSPNENAKTLLDVIDKTLSPMGSRLMKRWVAMPLKDLPPIKERQAIVETFIEDESFSDEIGEQLSNMVDVERIVSKVATGRISPKEVVQLKRSLEAIEPIKLLCEKSKTEPLKKIAEQLNPCKTAIQKIATELVDDPPYLLSKGQVIAEGFNDELDELRKIAYSGKDYLAEIQKRESEQTGIPSLKISFNNVFGYYLEVTNTHKDKVPNTWVRKQTLTNSERYITEELKEYEQKILGAEEKIASLESRLFNELVLSLSEYIIPVQLNAHLLAKLDCLLAFANISKNNGYTKPHLNDSYTLDIKDGRHPVIEQQLPPGESYIANDIYLDNEQQQIIMITGPNMAGKSALLRQTALIVIMAQIGCFVPAKHAELGITDKIFTRVGASDNISSGESTFMVEMNETASILNNVSDRSLVLLDEIGRGTSTYDGISIAWAIAAFLHEHSKRGKTLFATHYHELNDMCNSFDRIKNYNVSVKEIENKILFMRKLVPGGTNHSFGIHVAKMAGMPRSVIDHANKLLKQLESRREEKKESVLADDGDMQLSFFQLDDPVLEQIKEDILNTDIDTLTPVEALFKLNEIKKLIGG